MVECNILWKIPQFLMSQKLHRWGLLVILTGKLANWNFSINELIVSTLIWMLGIRWYICFQHYFWSYLSFIITLGCMSLTTTLLFLKDWIPLEGNLKILIFSFCLTCFGLMLTHWLQLLGLNRIPISRYLPNLIYFYYINDNI